MRRELKNLQIIDDAREAWKIAVSSSATRTQPYGLIDDALLARVAESRRHAPRRMPARYRRRRRAHGLVDDALLARTTESRRHAPQAPLGGCPLLERRRRCSRSLHICICLSHKFTHAKLYAATSAAAGAAVVRVDSYRASLQAPPAVVAALERRRTVEVQQCSVRARGVVLQRGTIRLDVLAHGDIDPFGAPIWCEFYLPTAIHGGAARLPGGLCSSSYSHKQNRTHSTRVWSPVGTRSRTRPRQSFVKNTLNM